jgi:tRNA (guanine10-N2)-methyltransferase
VALTNGYWFSELRALAEIAGAEEPCPSEHSCPFALIKLESDLQAE